MNKEENIQEEQKAMSNELSANENISLQQPVEDLSNNQPENSNSKIENMEVHHHPDLHHKPKAWKEYFLEFLMIFLAVTLGFFAESYREHLNDQAKEKEYMKSITEELKRDTANFRLMIRLNKETVTGTDSLIQILMVPSNNKDTALRALKYLMRHTAIHFAILSDGTISQLKNNGGLRLLKNQNVANAIIQYYNDADNFLKYQASFITKGTNKIYDQAGHIFNFLPDVKDIIDTSNGLAYPDLVHQFPVMITKDRSLIIAFTNNMLILRGTIDGYIQNLIAQQEEAVRLIALIQKEYRLP